MFLLDSQSSLCLTTLLLSSLLRLHLRRSDDDQGLKGILLLSPSHCEVDLLVLHQEKNMEKLN